MATRFTLNGEDVSVEHVDPHITLLNWLRERGLTGTKEGCAEGECGACAVVLRRASDQAGSRYIPVNSCLMVMGQVEGQDVLTVEGIAKHGLHPVQDAMIRTGGSQCGYCTPGFVVSMFCEFYRPERASEGFDLESIAGNLCRCTGYRPIRDAGRSLPMVSADDPFQASLKEDAPALQGFSSGADSAHYVRPESLEEALRVFHEHPELVPLSGGTDLVVEMNQRHRRFPEGILGLEAVPELQQIAWHDDYLEIGAGVSLSRIEDECGARLPMLAELLPLFSSRLIRNRATLGGNLATASPIGDSPPVLLAMGAEIRLASVSGERVIAVDELFIGYRQTALRPGELIVSVRIPRPWPTLSRFYKVSKRHHDDISTVAAAFALVLDESGCITHARLAYGGVAATPVRAFAAEKALVGQVLGDKTHRKVETALSGAFTPMSDHRGSAQYRDAMVTSLWRKFYTESQESCP